MAQDIPVSGTGGIRTPGPCEPPAFKAGAFVRSATVPAVRVASSSWSGAGSCPKGVSVLRRVGDRRLDGGFGGSAGDADRFGVPCRAGQ